MAVPRAPGMLPINNGFGTAKILRKIGAERRRCDLEWFVVLMCDGAGRSCRYRTLFPGPLMGKQRVNATVHLRRPPCTLSEGGRAKVELGRWGCSLQGVLTLDQLYYSIYHPPPRLSYLNFHQRSKLSMIQPTLSSRIQSPQSITLFRVCCPLSRQVTYCATLTIDDLLLLLTIGLGLLNGSVPELFHLLTLIKQTFSLFT